MAIILFRKNTGTLTLTWGWWYEYSLMYTRAVPMEIRICKPNPGTMIEITAVRTRKMTYQLFESGYKPNVLKIRLTTTKKLHYNL